MSNILNIRMINAKYYLINVQMLIFIFVQELKQLFFLLLLDHRIQELYYNLMHLLHFYLNQQNLLLEF